jgi:hypothetical protein
MANGYIKNTSADPIQMWYPFAVTAGRIAGHSRIVGNGHIPTATAGADCWEGGGAYPFQSTATVLEILSASANDTAAGTGGRTFLLEGLDANFNPINETLTLNGVTPVQTVKSYLRVNRLVIASAGSGNVNAGDVTLRVTGAGATQGIARAGTGFAKTCIYTVPTGFTLFLTDGLFQCGAATGNVNIVFSFTRIGPTGLITLANEFVATPSVAIGRDIVLTNPIVQQTTITTRITSVMGASNVGYSSFEGVLIDNSQLS